MTFAQRDGNVPAHQGPQAIIGTPILPDRLADLLVRP